jgi:hypothetical protein
MKYEKVLKFLEIIGTIYMIVSLIEIASMIILNFTQFVLDGNPYLLSEIVYFSNIFPLSGTFLWFFVNISVVFYLIMGIYLFKISRKNNIESIPLAKLIVVLGMIILLGGFVKMNYLVLLGKTRITTSFTIISFQTALYDPLTTAFMPAVFWIYFISLNCFYLLSGLMITAVGIKYTLLQEQAENEK